METISKIRRDHWVHGKSIRQITGERGVSRNTVRRVLRENRVEMEYLRRNSPRPKMAGYDSLLESLLEHNRQRPVRDRQTVRQFHEQLTEQGYQGSYRNVCRYARKWRDQQASSVSSAYVPLEFQPGEAYQFDWSQEQAWVGGRASRLKVAQMVLCYSRKVFLSAYRRESQEMLFDAHNRAFAYFGGCCERGIYDNPKTMVDAITGRGERKLNYRFVQMCSHYLVEPTMCNPAAAWEKGRVEKKVQDLRRRLFTPRPSFDDLEQCNEWLLSECIRYAQQQSHPEFAERSVQQVFEEECSSLIAYVEPFEAYRSTSAAVSKTCLVRFDGNRYSVAARAVGRAVEVYGYAQRVVIRQDGEVVGEHCRSFEKGQTLYDIRHYLPVLARKPGAYRNGAPFRHVQLPPAMAEVQTRLDAFDDGDQQMVKILCATMSYGFEAITEACAEALALGSCHAEVIINLASRRQQPSAIDCIEPPRHLRDIEVPRVDCARYDQIRERSHGT